MKWLKKIDYKLILATGAIAAVVATCIFKPEKEKIDFKTAVSKSEDYTCFDEYMDEKTVRIVCDGEEIQEYLFNAVNMLSDQLKVVELLPSDIKVPEHLLSEIEKEKQYGLKDSNYALELLEIYADFDSLPRETQLSLLNNIKGTRAASEKWINENGSNIAEQLCFGAIKCKVLDAYELDESLYSNVTIQSQNKVNNEFGADIIVKDYKIDKKGNTKTTTVNLTGELSTLQQLLYNLQNLRSDGIDLDYKTLGNIIDTASRAISMNAELNENLITDSIKLKKVKEE